MTKGDRYLQRNTMLTMGSYSVIVLVLSFFQAGYINADFVGYANVAHRILDGSGPVLSGYWSPLFSWLLVPFVFVGINDLAAGRIVLILGGALYLFAALRFMRKLLEHDPLSLRMLSPAYSICVVLQASIWATFLLAPDIIADGLLFLYLSIIADHALIGSRRKAAAAGLAAGFAYLAKAYMLPFVVIHISATMAMRLYATSDESRLSTKRVLPLLRTGCLVLAAMLLAAGPWIAVLSSHYNRLVFSTAGTSNYANVGPKEIDIDPLWNPGLVPDYMADPYLAQSWSPVDGWPEFKHQGRITLRNIPNGLGHVFPWVAFLVAGLVSYRMSRRKQHKLDADRKSTRAVQWCLASVVLYYSGYWIVNNEARYIAPVVSPLLCLSALVLIGKYVAGLNQFDRVRGKIWIKHSALCLVMATLFASSLDFYRIDRIITRHSQSMRLDPYIYIARQLREAHLLQTPFAANQWHQGMLIAYAGKCSALYMGAPLATEGTGLAAELGKSPAVIYLRFVNLQLPGQGPPGGPGVPEGWKLSTLVRVASPSAMAIEVYKKTE